MKICKKCGDSKDESEFNKKSDTFDGLNRYCKLCSRSFGKSAYNKNRRYYINKARRVAKEFDDMIKEMKSSTPCKDCGKKYPYYVMDFDHRDSSEKDFCIAHKSNWGRRKLLKEIKKCDIVCSNCHRERTHEKQV